jgi:flagellar basal-body rod protein FlgC
MAGFLEVPGIHHPDRQLMSSLEISARGMAIQMDFLEIISSNIANAETTRTPEGSAYRRQIGIVEQGSTAGAEAVRVVEDDQPGRLVYDPGHPNANEAGFVEYPNIDINTELVDLMIARRIHQANASVFQAAKSMLKRALEI